MAWISAFISWTAWEGLFLSYFEPVVFHFELEGTQRELIPPPSQHLKEIIDLFVHNVLGFHLQWAAAYDSTR